MDFSSLVRRCRPWLAGMAVAFGSVALMGTAFAEPTTMPSMSAATQAVGGMMSAPATAPAAAPAALPAGSVFTEVPDPSKPEQRNDPSGLDLAGSLFKANGWLAGWAPGGTNGANDGSDWKPFGYEKDKDGNIVKDKEGKLVEGKPTAENLAPAVAKSFTSINMVWTLIAGFLVMFMQAGFALVETGLCRAKNASHTMFMNFMVYALGMCGFFICGFAFMCGGANHVPKNADGTPNTTPGVAAVVGGPGGLGGVPVMNKALVEVNGWVLLGGKGFFLSGDTYNASAVVWFLFMMVFMDTTATIPTGALAERWTTKSFFIFSLFIGGVIYPIYGGWVWGGGWLAQMGMKWGLGHGAVDYAGSGVVHLQGGALALVTSWLLGPRIGKYDANGKPKPIPGHDVPMVLLGTFILAFGWFGFNAGSSLAGTDGRIGIVAVNTMLAGMAATMTGVLYMWCIHSGKKPDPTMACNSMLAGLVAITAPCAFVTPIAACIIGGIAGVIVIWSCFFFEKRGIDDPVGAISVHGLNGAWGILALGLFADGTYGAGFNGVGFDKYGTNGIALQGVTGLFYGDSGQFIAQAIDVGVCLTWNIVVGGIIFFIIGKVVGNRVAPEVEIAGLDLPETGVAAYPDFFTPTSVEEVSAEEIAAAKKALKLA